LNANENYLENFKKSIDTIQTQIAKCEKCGSLMDIHQTECDICKDQNRDSQLICVVEEYLDMQTIEQSGQFD
jgi:recombinational DNA repair protein RecR